MSALEVSARFHGPYAATVDVRGHAIAVDEPEHAGGADDGVMPTELLAASLASCFALALGHVARRDGAELRARGPRAALRAPARLGARRRAAGAVHGERAPAVLGLEHLGVTTRDRIPNGGPMTDPGNRLARDRARGTGTPGGVAL